MEQFPAKRFGEQDPEDDYLRRTTKLNDGQLGGVVDKICLQR